VLDEVTRESGTVKLEGEVWSARPIDEDEVYAPGTRVQVIQIQGATALVSD
jgi:membrane protein implicated in regulation of membrane protease activity